MNDNSLVCLTYFSTHKVAFSGLYYKHVMIINYASSGVNKLKASLNDDARVIIYDRHMFIVQAADEHNTGWQIIENDEVSLCLLMLHIFTYLSLHV
jgi:hypothetical protein